MTYTVETIEMDEYPHIRARIVLDECPGEPEDDGQSPILRVGASWRSSDRRAVGHVMTTSYQDHRRDAQIERAWIHFQEGWSAARVDYDYVSYPGVWSGNVDPEDAFERYLRIFHGVTTVKTWASEDYLYITYDPAGWRRDIGFESDEKLPANFADSINLDEWRAYCEGDVYGIVVEREIAVTDINGVDEDTDDWEEVDSCWGFYGDVDGYVTETAKEMITAEAIAAEATTDEARGEGK